MGGPDGAASVTGCAGILGTLAWTEFNYGYSGRAEAEIVLGLRLAGGEAEKESILRTVRDNGYPVIDMTDNDTAKLHSRYMVGGRPARRSSAYRRTDP